MWVATGGQEGERNEDREGETRQAIIPAESWEDVSVHGFWKWVTYALFDMRIVNLDTESYLHQTSAKALAMAEKEK